jgi:hypothetical protein
MVLGVIGDMRALPALQHAQQHDQGTDREGRRVADFAAKAIQEILTRTSSSTSPAVE